MSRSRNTTSKKGVGLSFSCCEGCFNKQRKIDELEQEVKSLKDKLKYRVKKDKEFFFGSSTPSSKIAIKSNSAEDKRKKNGGAKKGHVGNGRTSHAEENADKLIELKVEECQCDQCGGRLEIKETTWRSVVDTFLNKAQEILFKCEVKRCVDCKKTFSKKPTVLPKNKYGNNLITNSVIMHYFHGIPLKRLEQLWGENVVAGNLIKIFHRLAKFWKPIVEQLKKEYRESPVKHADETGWRNDGKNGYAWIFCSENTTIFTFRDTRSSEVARDILGTNKLPGVLVVDRYAVYNKSPCNLQYCYAHLLRDLEDLGKDFPDEKEVQTFVSGMAPFLAEAMHLRSKPITDKKFYRKAKKAEEEIKKLARAPAQHPGIHKYQDIFKEKEHRLYHWASDRRVPADNNRAERELRPTVIARKVSFGSQSYRGLSTRSILMTILHTASKRLKDQSLEEWFLWTLEEFIKNPDATPESLMPKV